MPRGVVDLNGYLKDFELGFIMMLMWLVKGFGELFDICFNVSGFGVL